ncbi:MAG: hypothetical protein KGL39_34790 [Patescibacteria group bacterium]|nr:hypothetical protein [Patescibacteria group bacterium]
MITLRESGAGVKPGERFGRRVALGWQFRIKCRYFVVMECDCGRVAVVSVKSIEGHESCGCFRGEMVAKRNHESRKHGFEGTRLYKIFYGMLARCYRPTAVDYCRYGAKGIRVCDEWRNNVAAFVNWALANGYADGLTIDRVDATKGYGPDNCQWITKSENSGKDNRGISFDEARAIREEYAARAAAGNLGCALADIANKHSLRGTAVQKILDGVTYRDAGGPIRTAEQKRIGRLEAARATWQRRRD